MKSKVEGPSAVYFNYAPSRDASVPLKLPEELTGALMVDGYGTYKTVATTVNKIVFDTYDSKVLLSTDPNEITSKGLLLCSSWLIVGVNIMHHLELFIKTNPNQKVQLHAQL
ncbi:MAG: IS66 family transposase [Sphaerochaeta sp.]